MAYSLPQRPRTAAGHSQLRKSSGTNAGYGFQARVTTNKPKSVSSNFRHPAFYENVETFNVRPGYRLAKSAGKLFVRINPEKFFDPPKPESPPERLDPKQMEALVADLREQIAYLTTFLDDERLRHEGTRKRAVLDLESLGKKLKEEQVAELEEVQKKHEEIKEEMALQHNLKIVEVEMAAKKHYDELRSEYRLLQASFKNFRSNLQDEMNGQWNFKMDEVEWDKKRAIDNAVDDCKRVMEDKFSEERNELKKQFRTAMTDMMSEHKLELEELMRKLSGNNMNIEEMKHRSAQLDETLQEMAEVKQSLRKHEKIARKAVSELEDTRLKLAKLENQFEDRVAAVDDKHRSRIDALLLEKSQVRLKLAKSCSDLQSEKIGRELAETALRERAKQNLKLKIRESGEQIASIERTLSTQRPRSAQDESKAEYSRAQFEPIAWGRSTDSLSNEIDLTDLIHGLVLQPRKTAQEVLLEKQRRVEKKQKRERVSTAPAMREPLRFNVPPLQKQDSMPSTTNDIFQIVPNVVVSQTSIPVPPSSSTEESDAKRPPSPSVIY